MRLFHHRLRLVQCGRLAILAALMAGLLGCGDSNSLLLKVSDEDGHALSGIEIWQVGVEASLGVTRGDGTADLSLTLESDEPVNLRLGAVNPDREEDYTFENPYPIHPGDLNSGKRVIRVRHREVPRQALIAQWNVTTDPAGANVIISDRPQGTTPVTVTIESPGPVEVILRKDGYEDVHFNFLLGPGDNEPIHVPMVPTDGSVAIDANQDEPGHEVADARVAGLKERIPDLLRAKDWTEADALVADLLDAAPGDPDASRWSRDIAAGRQGDRQRARVRALKTTIPVQIEGGDLAGAEGNIQELLQLAASDPQGIAWQREIVAMKSARREVREPDPAPIDKVDAPDPPADIPQPPVAEDPETGIRALLDAYRDALENLDATAYSALWTDLDSGSRDRIERSFAMLKSQDISLNSITVDASQNAPFVRFEESRTLDPKQGPRQSTKRMMRMTVVKAGGEWRISKLEAQ